MKNIDLSKLDTEQRNERSTYIDRMSTSDILTLMNTEDQSVATALKQELQSIEQAVEKIIERFKQGGRIIYVGAGTSGRLGVLDAVECPPTYGLDPSRVIALLAGGGSTYGVAKEKTEDIYEQGTSDCFELNINSKDSLIGIAASGRTPYVNAALDHAKTRDALCISVACTKHSEIGKLADVAIEVNCGPEVVTGSTRLKAGTAQKMILNMISTTTMIRLGKVYENLMICVDPSNDKLVERWKKMVMEAAGKDYEEATNLFQETQGDAKLAIVMSRCDCDKTKAMELLLEADGQTYLATGDNR